MKTTFQDLLREYLFGPARPVRYWQRYKERLRRHGFDHKNIYNCRARALAKMEKRHKKQSNRLLIEEFAKRDFLLSKISKDTSWTGSSFVVPFRPGVRVEPIVFGGHHKEWK